VENILSNYELPRERAQEGLKELYRQAVEFRAKDLQLSDEEIGEMRRLRYVLGVDEDMAKAVETELLRVHYRAALRKALEDGHLTDAEKTKLDAMAINFGLPEAVRDGIYTEEVTTAVQQAFNEAIADRRLTPEEDQRLAAVSANLGVTVTHSAETQRNLDRFRLLARIENGHLPVVQTTVLLQRGEVCHATYPSTLHELRTVTKAIRYHGPSGSIRIMKGLSWRYGSMNVQRVTSEQLRALDSGTLLVTNKRLLFNGTNKNSQIPLKRMIHFTLFQDAIQIEKDSGRDQFFKGGGDTELVGAILEAALAAR